jgi:catechol 2,3-dioxygenase-like lactoylglutathione lyase family enzyme
MPMLGSRRAYATIPATDLDRAKRWYQEKLGLTPVREVADAGVMYQVGEGSGFFLYPTSNAGKAPNTLMSFSAEDIVADVAALKKRGVVFEEYDVPGLKTVNSIATLGNLRGAWFKDSEGNIIAIGEEPI